MHLDSDKLSANVIACFVSEARMNELVCFDVTGYCFGGTGYCFGGSGYCFDGSGYCFDGTCYF